jgi:hypothetical protein
MIDFGYNAEDYVCKRLQVIRTHRFEFLYNPSSILRKLPVKLNVIEADMIPSMRLNKKVSDKPPLGLTKRLVIQGRITAACQCDYVIVCTEIFVGLFGHMTQTQLLVDLMR